ncbi:MAG: TolC family protein [Gemmatirosa sp.]
MSDRRLRGAAEHCVERMGLLREDEGLPRFAGRMLGYLALQAEPAPLEDIAAAPRVSEAGVRNDARRLEGLRLVERAARPADRRDFSAIAPDMPPRVVAQEVAEAERLRASQSAARDLPETPEVVQTRLTAFGAFCGWVIGCLHELLVDACDAASLATLDLERLGDLRVSCGRQTFPGRVLDFSGLAWRTDLDAGVGVPIFDGRRTRADVQQAQVTPEQERLRLDRLHENVRLQYEQALGERQRAAASLAARERTVRQAQRVHDPTMLRSEQRLASRLEVSDARQSPLQSRTNGARDRRPRSRRGGCGARARR